MLPVMDMVHRADNGDRALFTIAHSDPEVHGEHCSPLVDQTVVVKVETSAKTFAEKLRARFELPARAGSDGRRDSASPRPFSIDHLKISSQQPGVA